MKKENTLSLTRTYESPLKFVWEAWTDADHLSEWWAPQGLKLEVIDHDFNEGGEWNYLLEMNGGKKIQMDGVYQEIDDFVKIVTTANWRPQTINTLMEIDFRSVDDNTEVTIHVHHNSPEEMKKQDEMGFQRGWTSTMDRLGEYLNSFFL